jgi:squalene-associated FAD-dependent desaturase
MRADVVVIGAGVAGLSAAAALADAGLRVVVVEQAPRLGGRTTSFVDRETGESVDNGQHVLFGCYRETYAFLDRLGVRHLAPLQPTLTLTMAGLDGRAFELRCPRLPPPWHLIGGLMRWSALPLADRWSARGMRPLLTAVRRQGAARVASEVDPRATVTDWLRAHHQSPRLCQWLWGPLAVAALNQSPDVAAAAPFVRVVGELFGPTVENSAIGLPAAPLGHLFGVPAARFIEARGGTVLTSAPARVVVNTAGAIEAVQTPMTRIEATVVLSAVPWHALGRLWDPAAPAALAGTVARALAMASSPIVTANLWFDGPVLPASFVGFVGGPMHWAFDKAALFGQPAGHVSVVASDARALAALDNAGVTEAAMAQLHAALPAARTRRLLRSVVVREHRATFSLAPGEPVRPPAATALDRFVLAGDWTATGLPPTIEGAIASGHAAARLIVERIRRAGATPMTGA